MSLNLFKRSLQAKIKYEFSGSLWNHDGPGGWFFVSLPKDLSNEIRSNLKWQEEGWGRMKATAKINGIEWDTAIWFDKKLDTYLLPIKTEVRKKVNPELNDSIQVSISL